MKQCTQTLINQHLMDINPLLAGWATDWDCTPKWSKTQPVHMTLYYIKRGSFTLVRQNGTYDVHAGQCFFVPLKDRSTYTTGTPGETYDFCWVGFSGTLSHRFADISAPMDVPEDQLLHLKELQSFEPHTAYDLAADLLCLRSVILDGEETRCDYIQHILDYIQSAYMHPITVESLAAQVGLDRSYLSRLFKQKTGQTLQAYLQLVRIYQAKTLLIQGCSVKEATYQCGFGDVKNFHKVFLRHEGLTPNQWKKCVRNNLAALRYDWPDNTKHV
ncbi:MAG: helix-turn-helix domain-containing protein [Oscillospiraceae bacterium]|nr:helix-turn-helix domain-containing protein [Oscillospiraceae bacterium]